MYLTVISLLLSASCTSFARPQGSTQGPSSEVPKEINKLLDFRIDDQVNINRSADSKIRNSTQNVANTSVKLNATENFTMDVRTPPKIRLQQKNHEKQKLQALENSHPGIAIPVEIYTNSPENTAQKKNVIQKIENKKPTTNSGLSTWILLSEPSTTLKPTKKVILHRSTIGNITSTTTDKVTTAEPKIKSSTTSKPTTRKQIPTNKFATVNKNITIKGTNTSTEDRSTVPMTKIKASLLNSALNNKTKTTTASHKTHSTTQISTTAIPKAVVVKSSTTQRPVTIKPTKAVENASNSSVLPPQAKIGSINLDEASLKTSTRPTIKRKKNKNRRKRPQTNSTKIAQKEKPLGSQIYNYLSREVMPTVGVGLVGLMVTAGLASYFFNPFGGLRRAYEEASDRKDQYYYNDYSPEGIAEEEMIGKVIAGMPSNSDYSNSYESPSNRNDFYPNEVNYKYRKSDFHYANDYQATSTATNNNYRGDVIEKEIGFTVDDNDYNKNQFVVGSYPKDYGHVATPASVPEHGPRRLRMRRDLTKITQDQFENEIDSNKYTTFEQTKYIQEQHDQTTAHAQTTSAVDTEMDHSSVAETQTTPNFFQFLRNLFEIKFKFSLNFLQNTTKSFSKYLAGVQERIDRVFSDKNNTESLH